MQACMRDGVVWFALMAVREEQQPASSGVRYSFSSLVNTLSVPALHSLPSPTLTPLGRYMKMSFNSMRLFPVYWFCLCSFVGLDYSAFQLNAGEKKTKW